MKRSNVSCGRRFALAGSILSRRTCRFRVTTRKAVWPHCKPPANGQPGLVAEYFTNAEMQGSPALTRTEARIDFGGPGAGSAAGIPDQWSSVRWTGYYTPANAGSFDIFVQAPGEDVHYRLFVD